MAIVGAAIGSWFFFDFIPNYIFIFGTILVILSICLYTAYPYQKPRDNIIVVSLKEKLIQ